MATKPLPAPAVLRQLLSYDPETGNLFWKERGAEWFDTSHSDLSAARWNGKHAGVLAFISVHKQGYRQGQISRHTMKAHRVAWAVHFGKWPDGEVDHINGDTGDNRLRNLRVVSRVENNRNAARRRDNTSGVAGVKLQRGKWIATIGVDGKQEYLGIFAEKDDAVSARKQAEIRCGYHPNHGR